MRRYASAGAAIGMALAALTPYSYGVEYPGEAWAWVGGVTLDRVTVPPYPEGQAVMDSPRVRNMATIALGAWAAIIAVGGLAGGGLGAAYKRHRQRHASP